MEENVKAEGRRWSHRCYTLLYCTAGGGVHPEVAAVRQSSKKNDQD